MKNYSEISVRASRSFKTYTHAKQNHYEYFIAALTFVQLWNAVLCIGFGNDIITPENASAWLRPEDHPFHIMTAILALIISYPVDFLHKLQWMHCVHWHLTHLDRRLDLVHVGWTVWRGEVTVWAELTRDCAKWNRHFRNMWNSLGRQITQLYSKTLNLGVVKWRNTVLSKCPLFKRLQPIGLFFTFCQS